MAKIPQTVWIAGYEVPVNPAVPPEHGIWMEIDPTKYVERRGRPRKVVINGPELVTNHATCAKCAAKDGEMHNMRVRISELEEVIKEYLANDPGYGADWVQDHELVTKMYKIMKVSD
jgi:hypothetical protein